MLVKLLEPVKKGNNRHLIGDKIEVTEKEFKFLKSKGVAVEIEVVQVENLDEEEKVEDEGKQVDYKNMSFNDLRAAAKEKGINTYGMKAEEIINALEEA